MKIPLIILLLIPLLSGGQTDSITFLLQEKINHESEQPVHSILLYAEQPEKGFACNLGVGTLGQELAPVSENDRFKIASITKLFVATVIFQLIEEGKINLNDPAEKFLKNIDYLDVKNIHFYGDENYSDQITIEQLLSHRTGLADIFSDSEQLFFEKLMQEPGKQYAPESIVALYYSFELNRQAHFKPNEGWFYSDMNYVLLGLIIERVEQTTLAASIRKRILKPLAMEDTYFEYYEAPPRTGSMIHQYVGEVNFSGINTSFDWSGGGLVSTLADLTTFIKALFDLQLISSPSLQRMTDVQYTNEHNNRYGMGVDASVYNGEVYFGHHGFYGTYLGYCPQTRSVLAYSVSQAFPGFNVHQFIAEILRSAK